MDGPSKARGTAGALMSAETVSFRSEANSRAISVGWVAPQRYLQMFPSFYVHRFKFRTKFPHQGWDDYDEESAEQTENFL